MLQQGCSVKGIDTLIYGGDALLGVINNENFEFIKADIRDETIIEHALKKVDCVVHLAAIVGDPGCAKEPQLARKTNYEASINLFEIAKESGIRRFLFASTCSNYGKMTDASSYISESGELRPVSLYAELKVAVENIF